jgi:hypothetical protein
MSENRVLEDWHEHTNSIVITTLRLYFHITMFKIFLDHDPMNWSGVLPCTLLFNISVVFEMHDFGNRSR